MRTLTLAVVVIAVTGIAVAAPRDRSHASDPHQPTARQYAKQTFGPAAIGRSAAGAGVSQLRNTPKEWGQGGAGFAKRFGSAFGTHVINNGIHYGVSRARHEEFGYRPSGKTGFGPRLKYALTSTVITHKTTTGKRTVAAGQISGAFGSGLISRAWQPASTRTIGSGLATGGVMMGATAGTNVVREFWPEIRHPRRHHAAKQPPTG